MKIQILLTTLAIALFTACKKDRQTKPGANLVYKKVNASVKASDVHALAADINGDGIVDYSFFAQLTANSAGDHLYLGVNPVNGAEAKMGPPDDDRFLNAAMVIAYTNGSKITSNLLSNQLWSADFGIFAIRNTSSQGVVTYEGPWGDESEKITGLRLNLSGKVYYGWARVKFSRITEQLTLVDYAWNKNAGQEINAGQL